VSLKTLSVYLQATQPTTSYPRAPSDSCSEPIFLEKDACSQNPPGQGWAYIKIERVTR
jgi:hypothetical protein